MSRTRSIVGAPNEAEISRTSTRLGQPVLLQPIASATIQAHRVMTVRDCRAEFRAMSMGSSTIYDNTLQRLTISLLICNQLFMRIYFVGSHATGKTTMCRYVSRRYGLPMITEVARAVLAEMETSLDAL